MVAQQTTTQRITEVAWWKTMTPIVKVVQQTTILLIPVAVREKTTLLIAMAARPKTTPRIAVAVGQTTKRRNAVAAQQTIMPCIAEVAWQNMTRQQKMVTLLKSLGIHTPRSPHCHVLGSALICLSPQAFQATEYLASLNYSIEYHLLTHSLEEHH